MVAALFLAGCVSQITPSDPGAIEEDIPGWVRFSSENTSFVLYYPQEWRINQKSGSAGTEINIVSPLKNQSDKYSFVALTIREIDLSKQALSEAKKSLDSLTDEHINIIETKERELQATAKKKYGENVSMPVLTVLPKVKQTLDGNDAYGVNIVVDKDNAAISKAMEILCVKDDRFYLLAYSIKAGKDEENIPTFQKMIESFRFI